MTRFTLSFAAALVAVTILTALARGPAPSQTTPGNAASGTGAVDRSTGTAAASVNPNSSGAAGRR